MNVAKKGNPENLLNTLRQVQGSTSHLCPELGLGRRNCFRKNRFSFRDARTKHSIVLKGLSLTWKSTAFVVCTSFCWLIDTVEEETYSVFQSHWPSHESMHPPLFMGNVLKGTLCRSLVNFILECFITLRLNLLSLNVYIPATTGSYSSFHYNWNKFVILLQLKLFVTTPIVTNFTAIFITFLSVMTAMRKFGRKVPLSRNQHSRVSKNTGRMSWFVYHK